MAICCGKKVRLIEPLFKWANGPYGTCDKCNNTFLLPDHGTARALRESMEDAAKLDAIAAHNDSWNRVGPGGTTLESTYK